MTEHAPLPAARSDTDRGEQTEFEALTSIVRALQLLSEDARLRVLNAVMAFLGIAASPQQARARVTTAPGSGGKEGTISGGFSEDRSVSPKAFLFEKKPQTDIERVTTLAYYLTHYRDIPHFKTLDLSKLNTEAAQLKLGNPAKSVNNATSAGLLVPASKGAKQLSSLGELYVQALPNRVAARAAIADARPKRKPQRSSKAIIQVDDEPEAE